VAAWRLELESTPGRDKQGRNEEEEEKEEEWMIIPRFYLSNFARRRSGRKEFMIGMPGFRLRMAVFVLCLLGAPAWAAPVCTVVTEASDGKQILRQGPQCDTRTAPQSTFKIALSLIGYDRGVLQDERAPAWPYKPEYEAWLESWKKTVDPTSWQRDSVVWYSRELTRLLGAERLQQDVDRLDYGNRDLSGDPGKNNGLTNAWLSSSLQISPDEQIVFLRKLLSYQAPVSKTAVDRTLAIIPQFPLADGWIVHGKSGTGLQRNPDGGTEQGRQVGWFVGWAQKGEHKVVFAHLIKDDAKNDTFAGLRARDAMLADLPRLLNGGEKAR
jgi:beta-lactamase class D